MRARETDSERKLDSLRGKRVVLLGIGHPDRGDDAAGVELARRLREKGFQGALAAGGVPENFLGLIERSRPDIVLIADAAATGREPGSWSLEREEEISRGTASTHDASIATVMEYLRLRTGAKLYLLAIQPEKSAWGGALSPAVLRALDELERLLGRILG